MPHDLVCQPFPRRHILDSFKQKEFAEDNFKFDENGGKFSKRVENTVGTGETVRYKQFLPFQRCFQKTGNQNFLLFPHCFLPFKRQI